MSCTREDGNTPPYAHDAPQTHIFSCGAQLFIQCTSIVSSGLPANPVHFPTSLETGFGANCADPRSGSWFGRVAEQSPLPRYQSNSLIDISNEYTPINFPSRRNSFNTDLNSVPTTAAASDVTDFHDERADFFTVYTGNRRKCQSL